MRIDCAADVSDEIASDLRRTGIPTGLIGYEYQRLREAALLDGIGESGLVVFGTSGLFGRFGIDAAARRVVHIPTSECAKANHVNRDLRVFHECVAAAIARFPFYEAGEEERFQAAADELRERVTTLDDTALAHNGLVPLFLSA
ncbi:SUKH-4 family immunity protein [Streptomyces sp. NBC_00425]|uniref:SUKH-4 family immunity protein n=1 Tax=Streptomyces sp. NBC_00425 TaxID=2975740 RepID=UPI002E1D70A2